MIKRILFSIMILVTLYCCSKDEEIGKQPDAIVEDPVIYIPSTNTLGVIINTKQSYEGFTLFSSSKNTYLINNCGQVINKWTSSYKNGNAVYLLDDGSILRAGKLENNFISIGGIGGIIEKFDWYGNLKWSFIYSSANYSHHHDMYPLPNGNILLLALSRKTKEEATLSGRDPNLLPDGELYTEQVIEIVPTGTSGANIVWKWDIWDHLIQDFDNTKLNYGVIKDNPQLLNINFANKGNGKKDWLHFNSVQFNQKLDQIILSSQALSEIYIIDHTTTTAEAASNTGGLRGKGGDILYRYGNPIVYDSGTSSNQTLFGQHYAHWIQKDYPDAGKLLVFNNGLGRASKYSSVNIIDPPLNSTGDYILPESGSSFLPRNFYWTYIDPVIPSNLYSKFISSGQRLPNGNTLICEGAKGHFFEIDADFNIVWKYINPNSVNGIMTQGDSPAANPVFRAIKYSINHPAFEEKDLRPGNPIEQNSNIGNCY